MFNVTESNQDFEPVEWLNESVGLLIALKEYVNLIHNFSFFIFRAFLYFHFCSANYLVCFYEFLRMARMRIVRF